MELAVVQSQLTCCGSGADFAVAQTRPAEKHLSRFPRAAIAVDLPLTSRQPTYLERCPHLEMVEVPGATAPTLYEVRAFVR